VKTSQDQVPKWLSGVLSSLTWASTLFFTVFFNSLSIFLIGPLTFFWDKKRNILHGVAVNWARAIIQFSPISLLWRIHRDGEENIEPGRHYVVVANHQSLLDILIVLAALPIPFKFMAKKELFSIPFLGWQMAFAGYIPIDRGKVQSGRNAMSMAREWLKKDVSVVFFPEGTRSPDGEVHDFKSGAFKAAQEEKIQILPVVINGTWDAVPKKSWRLEKKTDFSFSICKPVSIQPDESFEQARDRVRETLIRRLAEIRKK